MNEVMFNKKNARWANYFLKRSNDGGFDQFWKDHLNSLSRNLLFIIGHGFDPRMCLAVNDIIQKGGNGVRDCWLLEFQDDWTESLQQIEELKNNNSQILSQLFPTPSQIQEKPLTLWVGSGNQKRWVGSRNAMRVFLGLPDIMNYTDVIVDISAMPRLIYFPLIGKILETIDEAGKKNQDIKLPNIHVIVCEDAALDLRIESSGFDEKTAGEYIPGFARALYPHESGERPVIWIPILGEKKKTQLNCIYNLVKPQEICPILPSPSYDPRRGDNLITEYYQLLFDQWRVEPTNIIYASEQNPFEVYRQISTTVRGYRNALDPIGGCKTAVSTLSSKLMSIGVLLAAYEFSKELEIGVAHVVTQQYTPPIEKQSGAKEGEFFTMWLTGECYES